MKVPMSVIVSCLFLVGLVAGALAIQETRPFAVIVLVYIAAFAAYSRIAHYFATGE